MNITKLVAVCPDCGNFQSIHEDWRPCLGHTAVAFDCIHCGMNLRQTVAEATVTFADPEEPATLVRFRAAALRSLDAVKHCHSVMKPEEIAVDQRLRNTTCDKWTVKDMNTIISANHRINNRIA
jgi:hypothetical protein